MVEQELSTHLITLARETFSLCLVIARAAPPPVAIHLLLDCLGCPAYRNDRIVKGGYHVYIVTNQRNGTLYTGVTNDLKRRVWQHKSKAWPGFSAKYGLGQLVYFESFCDITEAINREKQIKAGSRAKKIALIVRENPQWNDLSMDWFE